MHRSLKLLAIKLGLKRPPQPPQRTVPLGPISKRNFLSCGYTLKKLYGNNEITTSRYTWYGFIFQNLIEQAQRIANFYFICIAVIQLFTDSPVTPALSIIPLVFVLGITMIKQGYEDWLRHKADREVNNIVFEVVTEEGDLKSIKAWQLEVGDIVLCRANSSFPCDILLLSSSEPNGECFVTTTSLDGETNLKRFVANENTRMFDTPEALAKELKGNIICQQPVEDLYDFSGRLTIQPTENGGSSEVYPVGPENLLLRGACLRDTDFVYGCVVYTGGDTKLALNSKGKKTKFSQVERKLNVYLAFILGFLLTCSVISTILNQTAGDFTTWYIPTQKKTAWIVAQTFLGFIVLYNYIIPISLYVTIELQKFIGSLFVEWDLNLYDEKSGEKAKANTSDLIEEMGQIEYLFTDKTGTLTENSMQFRKLATARGVFCLKNNKLYQEPEEESKGSTLDPDETDEYVQPVDLSYQSDRPSPSPIVSSVQTLLLVLSLCHTVRVERIMPEDQLEKMMEQKESTGLFGRKSKHSRAPRRGSSVLRRASAASMATDAVRASRRGRAVASKDYRYQASSPDEKAFVEACRDLGIVYHGQDESGMQVVTIQGEALRYRLLDVLEFDATRKCMSTVLQYVPGTSEQRELKMDNRVIVLCKGAETSLISRVATQNSTGCNQFQPSGDPLSDYLCGNVQPPLDMTPDEIMENVTNFASSGFRTLVMAARILSLDEWAQLKTQLDTARGTLEGREQALSAAYSAIERQFTLIGCTGIEDMLQDGVPETITALREAGIQVWVLTGDKEETAVNISYAAGHFFTGMNEARITKCDNIVQCGQTLRRQNERIQETKRLDPQALFGVVIDGQSLNFALQPALRELFVQCCLASSTVLCCRLTPLQKAEVVRLIKESKNPPPITAAIGDGANDVSMILEAHLGFGLFGKEGRQAVRASDYAFGRFRFLKRALLYHGHTFYYRVAVLVLYFFYKNLLFTLPQMLYQFFCAYSSQTVYPQLYLVLFNVTMTSIPILIYGIFEQPLPETMLLQYPVLYKCISHNQILSKSKLFFWLTLSTWHAFVSFFGVYFLAWTGQAGGQSNYATNAGGSGIGEVIGFGNLLIAVVFIITNVKIFLISYYLCWVVFVAWSLAFLGNLALFLINNVVKIPSEAGSELLGSWTVLWAGSGLGTSWFGLLVLVSFAMIPDFVVRAIEDQGWQWRLAMLEEEHVARKQSLKSRKSTIRRSNRVHGQTNVYQKSEDVGGVGLDQDQETTYEYTNPSFDWQNEPKTETKSALLPDDSNPNNQPPPPKSCLKDLANQLKQQQPQQFSSGSSPNQETTSPCRQDAMPMNPVRMNHGQPIPQPISISSRI